MNLCSRSGNFLLGVKRLCSASESPLGSLGNAMVAVFGKRPITLQKHPTLICRWEKVVHPKDEPIHHEFVFPKWQLSGRNTALVLGFGIEPLAEKTFHLLNANEDDEQNGSLINYEIKLACNIRPPNDHESYVIGSEFYQHSVREEANFIITVKLYDIEMAHSCRLTGGYENSIVITITKHGYLLRPSTSTGDCKNRVIVDEKVDGTPDEIKNSITCTICMENKRNVIFMPCSHAIVCKSCTEKIMSSSAPGAMKCPI
ncbi:hypothetical protein niasHT_027719 [Heterodera trifolii]|uniref:RING-type domain-containing protein n=1 Tax=Heterodera trifolii TaxID=157864 RepID=A0ABD2KCT3_9BILA